MRTIEINNEIAYECKKYPNIFITKTGIMYSIFVKGGQGRTNIDKPHIVKYGQDKDGYYRMVYSRNGKHEYVKVHTVVVEQFINDVPKNMVVNHIDGNKHNNVVENLEIVSVLENTRHAWRIGLCKKENHPNCIPIKIYDVENDIEYSFVSLEDAHKSFPELSKTYINHVKNNYVNFNLCLFKKIVTGNKNTDYYVECYYNGSLFKTFNNNKEAAVYFGKASNSISSAYKTQYPQIINKYQISFPNVSTIESIA